MRTALTTALLLCSTALAAGDVTLVVGEETVLDFPDLQKIAIGDGSIADVKTIGKDQVLVSGLGEGRTTLVIYKKVGPTQTQIINVKRGEPELTKSGELELDLERGALMSWKATGITRVQVGDPAVLETTLKGGKLQLRTKAAGHSDLVAYKGDVEVAHLGVTVKGAASESPQVIGLALTPNTAMTVVVLGATKAKSSNPAVVVASSPAPGVVGLETKAPGDSTVELEVDGAKQKLTVKVARP